jgi:hypothetical protein
VSKAGHSVCNMVVNYKYTDRNKKTNKTLMRLICIIKWLLRSYKETFQQHVYTCVLQNDYMF